ANEKSGRRPDSSIILVARIKDFTGAVADGIVRPRSELVLAAIDRPGAAAAVSGDLEAERGIGDDIHPRCGRHLLPIEDGDVLPSVAIKSADAVKELELRPRGELSRAGVLRVQTKRFVRRCDFSETFNLLGETAASAHDHNTRCCLKEGSHLNRQ